MNYYLVGVFCFFAFYHNLLQMCIYLTHECVYILVLFHTGYYRVWSKVPCVIQWVLVIYFITSIGHILV